MTAPTQHKYVEAGATCAAQAHTAAVLATYQKVVCTAQVVQMSAADELAFLATHF
jgi:hypothetical protein